MADPARRSKRRRVSALPSPSDSSCDSDIAAGPLTGASLPVPSAHRAAVARWAPAAADGRGAAPVASWTEGADSVSGVVTFDGSDSGVHAFAEAAGDGNESFQSEGDGSDVEVVYCEDKADDPDHSEVGFDAKRGRKCNAKPERARERSRRKGTTAEKSVYSSPRKSRLPMHKVSEDDGMEENRVILHLRVRPKGPMLRSKRLYEGGCSGSEDGGDIPLENGGSASTSVKDTVCMKMHSWRDSEMATESGIVDAKEEVAGKALDMVRAEEDGGNLSSGETLKTVPKGATLRATKVTERRRIKSNAKTKTDSYKNGDQVLVAQKRRKPSLKRTDLQTDDDVLSEEDLGCEMQGEESKRDKQETDLVGVSEFSGRWPKRTRKVNRLFTDAPESEPAVHSSTPVGRPKRKVRWPSVKKGQRRPPPKARIVKAPLPPNEDTDQLIGLRMRPGLRAKLNSTPEDERVLVISRVGNKILRGDNAPMRKNVHAWLAANKDYVLFDEDGAHKALRPGRRKRGRPPGSGKGRSNERRRRYTEVEEAGDESCLIGEGMDGDGDGCVEEEEVKEDSETDPQCNQPFRGQLLSDELQKELDDMDPHDRVRMWNRVEERSVSRSIAPKRKFLERYMRKHKDHDILDPQRSDSVASRKTRRSAASSDQIGFGPLSKARTIAMKKADQLSKNVYNIIGSLRIGDPVIEYRRNLEKEVERIGGLDKAVRRMRDGKFLEAASELLTELHSLDIYDVFGEREGDAYLELPSFTMIRSRLENGDLGGMEDVWIQVCENIAYLLDFFEDGCVSFCSAERLFFDGGRVWNRFKDDHAGLFAEERALARMYEICVAAFKHASKLGIDIPLAVSQMVQVLDTQRLEADAGTRLSKKESVDGVRDGALGLITHQQTVVKFKSNYRDEKGFSHLGKQQSAKVLSLALIRPGYGEDEITTRSAESEELDLRHELSCHFCRRVFDDSASSALCCTNNVYRKCRKAFCFQCTTSTFSMSDEDFMNARTADVWICFHCRLTCPKRRCSGTSAEAICTDMVNDIVDDAIMRKAFALEWRHDMSEPNAAKLDFAFARRGRSGTFFEFGPPHRAKWIANVGMMGMFVASSTAPLGAYRCKVLIGGQWIASFCFQLLPSPNADKNEQRSAKSTFQSLDMAGASIDNSQVPFICRCENRGGSCADCRKVVNRSGSGTSPTTPLVGKRAVEHFARNHARSVRWSVASNGGTSAHEEDMPLSLSGVPNRSCSRTEGYDWRSAKLFSTVKWKGDTGVPTFQEPAVTPRCAFPVDFVPLYRLDHDGISPGEIVRDYDVARSTLMYHAMRDRQWGIITAKSGIHGIGLFTMTGYNKGDFVIEYAGQLIRHQVGDLREVRYTAAGLGTYLFKLNDDQIVDATMKSNRARFLNHSCDPNMESKIVSVKDRDVVIFIATRRIPSLAELTFNYQLPLEDSKLVCRCNSARCRGVMN